MLSPARPLRRGLTRRTAPAVVLAALLASLVLPAGPAPASPAPASPAPSARFAPRAMWSGRTGPSRTQARVLPAGPAGDQPLPLGSLALGTYVTSQFDNDGILFSGQSPFIAQDTASPVNPVLSGTPKFNGTIVGTFVRPGTRTPTTVSAFSLDVGYIDNPGSVQMTVYNSAGQQLGVLVATQVGFNELSSTFPGAASFAVSSVASEPQGWEINTILVGHVTTTYAALGDSYSSGEGTSDFPWSAAQGTQCDTGPLAWPVQLADSQDDSLNGVTLTIGPDTLIACQGERTYQMNAAVNGEKASELAQLSRQVASNGSPALVTLTIGGNDLGFASILKSCFLGGAEYCLHVVDSLDARVTTGRDSLIATLAGTYQAVAKAAGPSATVAAVGYPNLFPAEGGLGRAISVTLHCPWLRDTSFPGGFLGFFDPVSPFLDLLLGRISAAQAALNDDMAAAAAEAGIEFAPIPAAIQGHELCTGDSDINSLFEGITGNRNAGHPTVAGQAAIASAAAADLGLGQTQLGIRDPGTVSPGPGPAPVAAPRLAASPLSFPGGPLAGATVGAAYLDFLVASGGTGADTWAISHGRLPPGLSLDPRSGTISGTPTAAGTYHLTARVTDSAAPRRHTASGPVTIKVSRPAPLKVAAAALPAATAGQPYIIALASSGGLGPVTWSVTGGRLPAGLRLLAATGQVSGIPAGAGKSAVTVTATATGPSGRAERASARESITVQPASARLTVRTGTLPRGAVGQDYAGQLSSSGGRAPVQWSVVAGSLPPGLSLDDATGVLTGIPARAGTFRLTVKVADGTRPTARTATARLSVKVAAGPRLAISPAVPLPGIEGAYYSASFQATGGANGYQWGLASGFLPDGLVLNPSTGQLSGVPVGTGTYRLAVAVTDAGGRTATRSFTIRIGAVRLTVSSKLPAATVGSYYAANIRPSGGVAPYAWTRASGTLPAGLRLDPATGTILGTPARSGSFRLKVAVTDGAVPVQRVTASVRLTVHAAPRLRLTGPPPPRGYLATPYSSGIGYSGGHGPYTWAVTAGHLPPGLTLSHSMITGTPAARGTYRVTVRATDSSRPAQVASRSLRLVIGATPRLAITTRSLPLATQGTSYLAGLAASGGIAPYTWSLASGTLPAGLYLDFDAGIITGTPTGRGQSAFTLKATDSADPAATITRRFTLTVSPAAPLTVATTGLDDATQGVLYFEPLAADGGVPPYTWTITQGRLPAGLELIGDYIEGTPTGFGPSTFTVTLTDGATPKAAVARQVLTLNVQAAPPG